MVGDPSDANARNGRPRASSSVSDNHYPNLDHIPRVQVPRFGFGEIRVQIIGMGILTA
jgi:hypothetical protein